jgi:hypothetical protein
VKKVKSPLIEQLWLFVKTAAILSHLRMDSTCHPHSRSSSSRITTTNGGREARLEELIEAASTRMEDLVRATGEVQPGRREGPQEGEELIRGAGAGDHATG